MTQESRMRIAMLTLVDTMIDRNYTRADAVKRFKASDLSLEGKRAKILNENMAYIEDLNRVVNGTLAEIISIMKEEKT